jgi:peroxiredoxin
VSSPGLTRPPGNRTRRRRITIAAAAVVAVIAAALAVTQLTGSAAGLPAVGSVIPASQRPPAPAISGTTLTGAHLNVASLRGAPVVINFWGSWCSPCQAEAPALARLAADTRPLGVHVVGIDVRDNPSAGLAFEQGHQIPFPSISDPNSLIAATFGAVAPTATPSTYILDARGRIAWAYFGRTQYNQLELAVLRVAHS